MGSLQNPPLKMPRTREALSHRVCGFNDKFLGADHRVDDALHLLTLTAIASPEYPHNFDAAEYRHPDRLPTFLRIRVDCARGGGRAC
ncbi:hypothetical protein [Burkholderia multivorans]|uniref:hypothetical protein n=1 Tax=Burkholderia multivorans TaxID=87883 RepID=UPI0011B25D11|nr:hypothetical protein [Burkholderia multivorans]MCO1368746.1 hypothetical protein [Burkholderia multivorans]MCO1380637.1 hypothetical protein [Burkholderia multivorans]MDN8032501.1 hypothetical protein [Burkholderia multivorans]UQP21937.1 hypothetical protein L0Y98_17470 [Burkholderia multivorans]UQP91615.1 hypothetical protein L0Y91_29815 [Burkholderia multivorans]